MRSYPASIFWLLAAWVALAAADARAQNLEGDDEIAADDSVDEIVVVAPRPGDPVSVEARYETLLKSRLQKEVRRLRDLDEEYEWRKTDTLKINEPDSRIKWGYDPRVELEVRRNTDLTDLPIDDTKPATLFRFEF